MKQALLLLLGVVGLSVLAGQNLDPCGCAREPRSRCCEMRASPDRDLCLQAERGGPDAGPEDDGACPGVVAREHPWPGGGRAGRFVDPALVLFLNSSWNAFYAEGWMAMNVRSVFQLALGEGWRFMHRGAAPRHFWVDDQWGRGDVFCYTGHALGSPAPWNPVSDPIWPLDALNRPPWGKAVVRPDARARTLEVACMPLETPGFNVWNMLVQMPPGPERRVEPIRHIWQVVRQVEGVAEVQVRGQAVNPGWATDASTRGRFWRDAYAEDSNPIAGVPCRP